MKRKTKSKVRLWSQVSVSKIQGRSFKARDIDVYGVSYVTDQLRMFAASTLTPLIDLLARNSHWRVKQCFAVRRWLVCSISKQVFDLDLVCIVCVMGPGKKHKRGTKKNSNPTWGERDAYRILNAGKTNGHVYLSELYRVKRHFTRTPIIRISGRCTTI